MSRDSSVALNDSSPSSQRDSMTSLNNSPPSSSHHPNKFTCGQIQLLLKTKPNEFIIVENNGRHVSSCWSLFGFPAIVNSNGGHQRIDGFVSCRSCFSTYSFVSNSTRVLKSHDCGISKDRSKTTEAKDTISTSTQHRLTTFYPIKTTAMKMAEVMKIKDSQAQLICQSIRPFSIVEDPGLRRLIQECISIGKYKIEILTVCIYSFF